jgi:phospho-N-acetylmuramoyl-pentapeptide-transferase
MFLDIVKVFLPATVAFIVGILLSPAVSSFLYRHELWKKRAGKRTLDGRETEVFNRLHETREVSVPRLGGSIVWLSVVVTTVLFAFAGRFFDDSVLAKFDFLSRDQTWIPLAALIIGALLGLVDDVLEVRKTKWGGTGGLPLSNRLVVITLLSLLAAAWFYTKLEVSTIGVPFVGDVEMGALFIPFFILVTLAVYAGGIIDGIDGLAGGIFAIIFGAYAGIAYVQDQINLAAFSSVVTGAILAFLWFNIPPARFYLSETGTMALTLSLAMVAFSADSLGEGIGVSVLPIIALPLVLTVLSAIIQIVWRKLFKKKFFQVAPLHHHFESLGWPPYKVTMRYWVVGVVAALMGMILAFIG